MTRKILIIVAVMVLLLAVGCKSGKKQEAENKDRVYLTLAANPTTGCTWMVTVEDNGVAEYVGSQYVADQAPEGMVGTGGNETFEFLFPYDKGGEASSLMESSVVEKTEYLPEGILIRASCSKKEVMKHLSYVREKDTDK